MIKKQKKEGENKILKVNDGFFVAPELEFLPQKPKKPKEK